MQPQAGADVSTAFQYGWSKFQQHFGQIAIAIAVWIGATIVFVGIAWAVTAAVASGTTDCTTTSFGTEFCTNDAGWGSILLVSGIWSLGVFVAQFVGTYAIIRGALAITAGRPLTTSELFDMKNFVPFILVGLVVSVITAIGSFLCYIPGLIAWFFLFLAPYYAADRGMGVGEALRASVTTMNRNLARMIGFFVASIIAYIIGAILCGIGLLVAIPVVIIASAYMYRTTNGEPVAP
jgi:uncharacterized membrane protein